MTIARTVQQLEKLAAGRERQAVIAWLHRLAVGHSSDTLGLVFETLALRLAREEHHATADTEPPQEPPC